VSSAWQEFRQTARLPFIGLLICSVVQVPLPQPDYHNIRHHDAPGEICLYHHHLLRWHPTADADRDVALLHWHWFVPPVELAGGPGRPASQNQDDDSRPSLHAHIGDLLTHDSHGQSAMSGERQGRLLDRLGHELSKISAAVLFDLGTDPRAKPGVAGHGSVLAGAALRAGPIALLERWNC
jgi:hypothetical protein